ncbi:MAG: transporter substrate-binding domain-containing protein [Tannerellaceae bacterium]|jgi:ABC-type amino acid transport substrate-binding protein|nr:transporter substrate-binding domain-containing protein [Tannerellaceae bacterium]
MKSRKWIALYGVLLFLAVAVMALLRPAAKEDTGVRDYAAISEEGILRLVTEYGLSGYYVSGDTIEGFQYELIRAIARVSGLEVHTALETTLAESFRALDSRACDVIARNIPVTSDIRDGYLFTDPVVMDKQVLIQRTAEANGGVEVIRNQLDLAGKTIHIPLGSPALTRLQNLEHEMGDTLYIVEDEAYSSEQLAIMVAAGDIDYAVCGRRTALVLQSRLDGIDVDTDIGFIQLQAWAVRKESPILLDSLNSWLRQIRENGWYDAIYRRYY